jgi:hypothetical protein
MGSTSKSCSPRDISRRPRAVSYRTVTGSASSMTDRRTTSNSPGGEWGEGPDRRGKRTGND